jgi:hypothetical protein
MALMTISRVRIFVLVAGILMISVPARSHAQWKVSGEIANRLKRVSDQVQHGWRQLRVEEQTNLARQIWELRAQIDLLAWLGTENASKTLGIDLRLLKIAVKTAGTILGKS